MAKEHQWDVYLRPNYLTVDDLNDCIADVLTRLQTQHNADIAAKIAAKTAQDKNAVLAILNQRDEEVKNCLLDGKSFADSLVQISPRVSGVWATSKSPFDPAVHKRTVDLVLTQDFRSALDEVGVRVLGTKQGGAEIALVTDAATGKTDGTITAGDDIVLDGEKIKIQDEADETQGVFFIDSDGKEHRVSRRLTVNKPAQVIARVPADLSGEVKVVIRTKFTSGNRPLSTSREIAYALSCKVVSA